MKRVVTYGTRMPKKHDRGLVDTNVIILRQLLNPDQLPHEIAISAITLAELSAGPQLVRSNTEQDAYDEHVERARRIDILQRTENEFDPIAFDADAARAYGRLAASIRGSGRQPRRHTADILIAATAAAHGLPLYTTNPRDFTSMDDSVTVVAVERPHALD